MELTEIPSLILKIFRYSSSTKKNWLISIVIVISIVAFVSDLLYNFAYIRINNTKDAKYDGNYWIMLAIATISITIFHIIYSIFNYEYKLRKFNPEKHGVGIVPFDVISINPDTLSSFEKVRTLDEVMYQLFLAIDLLLDDDEFSKLFECRVLPLGLKVHNQQSSIELLKRTNAVLITRGILKEDAEGISLDLYFQGGDKLMLNETIILKKDVIESIANMIKIASYVSVSITMLDSINREDSEEKRRKLNEDSASYLKKSISIYEKLINFSHYGTDSSLHQKLEELLEMTHDIKSK